ncbi:MAG TPA: hypothetical protein VEV83_14125 [Parafilimonas sp.]|nr:hypothetical protein [Parafilimonas sp.]
MHQQKFIRTLFYASLAVFFTSCNNGGSSTTSTDTTSTDTNSVTTAPENTVSTTPQNMMIAKHKVKDFAKWKASYDEHDSLRIASGVHSYVIGRGLQDSNTVLVALKVDDMDKAKAFAKDPSLKQAMQKGGVMGTPSFSFVTMTFQDTAAINSDLRARSTFQVKDWDAWQKSFEESKQERLDNGITVRAYGHDADDNHKVELVTAITDTAKAFAYYKSDALKQRRAAGGVVGEPNRFLFRVVQRY